ncbi:MAG: rhomboid family intramembrane serine protease [Muribaculaceae bacterium]|nr:rhomboid family intramembrane serine protease [Muribaculaceae bacterium]
MSANFRLNSSSGTSVTLHLIIINVILWLATMLLGMRGVVDLTDYLGLHYWKGSDFHFYQLFTYMFMHDSSSWNNGIMHIFFNMFTLLVFGRILEKVMGNNRFIFFYLVCGVGAGLVQEVVWQFSWQSILASINNTTADVINQAIVSGEINSGFINQFSNNLITVGASGAVFGILLAFAMLFPNAKLYIMFIPIPVKAKWAVLGYGLMELFFGVSHTMGNVAHYAHLGGMLFGLILILYWKKKGIFNNNYVGI